MPYAPGKSPNSRNGYKVGHSPSEVTRTKMRLAKLGKPSPRSGVVLSEDIRKKISISKVGVNCGETSPNWKGDNVSYRGLHHWVAKVLGKANHCSVDHSHKSTRYHWGNISKEYKREVSDWYQLCPRCNSLDKSPGRITI